ncbi:divergent polysaccharide deacetylase family protein [Phaeobacter marinintestinus]|uniref:divergent polysaccharide deacetylase family protein n=1 Tax=Falsiphaeobacter marinintestinus TaxID=1492905 RepID=UPI0011B72135|nr:divergent polysaccharide deacetylase family protein [Phaeobacter marinintestinus]
MRGFFGGLVIGLVAAVVAVGALSLLAPRGQGPDVGARAPQAVPEAPSDATDRPADPSGADADLVEALPTAPDNSDTPPDGLGTLDDADTDPADKPQVGDATTDLGSPQPRDDAPEVTAEPEDPDVSQTGSDAPTVPSDDAAASSSISSEPSQPPMPELTTPETGFAARPPVAGETPSIGSAPDDATAATESANVDQPTDESSPSVSTDPGAAPQTEAASDTAPTPGTSEKPPLLIGGDTAPSQTTPGQPHTIVVDGTAPEADTTTPEAAAPSDPPAVAELPQAGSAGEETAALSPGLGTPVVPLTERNTGATAPAPGKVDPPIKAYAAAFDDPGDRPLMSILLIDDTGSVGAEALHDFPYPISFAIDPASPDAADKMAIHRAAGFEVVLLANLAATSSPQDAEVSFGVWLDTLPETVAILEGTGAGFQGNRGLSDQVTDIALSTGRGLILQSSGLNTAQKLAAKAGVPSSTVFRDFDGAGQTPTVIRRFLDQAAFRARQEGGVIMLGRVRPDTISALLLWGLQDRAQRVALAPVSAVLTQVNAGE